MSEQLIQLRCSELPIALKCAGSVLGPAVVKVNEHNDAADVGKAGHKALAVLVNTGRVDWDGVPEIAREFESDEQELRALIGMGAALWARKRESFPNASAELSLRVQFGRLVLTGHPDVLSLDRATSTVRVADWKLGRLDSDYRDQLLAYLALALLLHDFLIAGEALILWVCDGDGEPYRMDRAKLREWLAQVESEIINWDGTYRPGGHCTYCKRSHECSAANALARRDMAIIMDRDLPGRLEDAETMRGLREREPEQLVSLVEMAKRVQKQAERVIAAAKDEVIRAGDVAGGGQRLTLQEREDSSLDAWAAFPILQEALDDAEMAEVIKLSLPKAEEMVAKKAPARQGAAAKRALNAALAEAGAIKTSTSRALVVRRDV